LRNYHVRARCDSALYPWHTLVDYGAVGRKPDRASLLGTAVPMSWSTKA